MRVELRSAYVSIRQHTSAYVSICQHTSAYVTLPREAATKCAWRYVDTACASRSRSISTSERFINELYRATPEHRGLLRSIEV